MKHNALMILIVALILGGLSACGKEAIGVQCSESVRDLADDPATAAESFTVKCPANCISGSIWGVDTYTTDSSICRAALHAGVITSAGGDVTVTRAPGQSEYAGSERNGITSQSWGSWDSSFTVE